MNLVVAETLTTDSSGLFGLLIWLVILLLIVWVVVTVVRKL